MIPHTKDEYAPTKEDVRLNALKEEMLKEFDELLTSSMINQLSWEKMKESEVLHDMAEKSHSRIKSFLITAIDKAYALGCQETAKAFGGCTSCYGKGYNSVKIGEHSRKDFGDEVTFSRDMFPYVPCKHCNRGKQFNKVLEAARTNNLTDTQSQENDNFCTGCAECCPNQEKHKHPFIPLSQT